MNEVTNPLIKYLHSRGVTENNGVLVPFVCETTGQHYKLSYSCRPWSDLIILVTERGDKEMMDARFITEEDGKFVYHNPVKRPVYPELVYRAI